MSIDIQIINIINDKLKNPIFTTMKLLNLFTKPSKNGRLKVKEVEECL